MKSAPLIIGLDTVAKLRDLRERAAKKPVDVVAAMEAIKTPAGKAKLQTQMDGLSVEIPGPYPFMVTFSIETNQPCGPCRHMSMSVMRKGRVPHPEAVWMIAEELGFSGGLGACATYPEHAPDGQTAINVVQPLAVASEPEGKPS